jgi:ubiquitin carboxyl-terminal hydrolase 8
MWQKNSVVNPSDFHNELRKTAAKKKNDTFTGYDQNDASEFLVFILDLFHEACKLNVNMKITGKAENKLDKMAIECYKQFIQYHENDYSLFTKLFFHMTVTSNISIYDKKLISQRFQSNFILDVPVSSKKECTIYDCLNYYFEDVFLKGENGIIDEKSNKKIDIVQKTSMWNAPPVLILCIKRFSYDGRKNNSFVQFPIDTLDMSKYISGYHKNKKYELYGVCNHSGVAAGGHYTSFVKTNYGEWYLFNDTLVTKVSNSIDNTIISPKAYCLFYRLKN